MEVTVTKFERNLEDQKVLVRYYIKKKDTEFASVFGAIVEDIGTNDDIVKKGLELLETDILSWLSTEKNVVGKTFIIPIPANNTVDNTVSNNVNNTVDNTVVQTIEVPLSSSNQTNS